MNSFENDANNYFSQTTPSPSTTKSTIPLPSFSDSSKNSSLTFRENLINFLFTSNQGSMLAASIALAIGLSIKDVLTAIVNNIFKPVIVFIIIKLNLTVYYDFTSLIGSQDNAMNFSTVISSIVTFILMIILCYFANNYVISQHNIILKKQH